MSSVTSEGILKSPEGEAGMPDLEIPDSLQHASSVQTPESDVPQLPHDNVNMSNPEETASWNWTPTQQFSCSNAACTLTMGQRDVGSMERKLVDELGTESRRRMVALVEVIITYGTACSNHWDKIFLEIRSGLRANFGNRVFVMAQEDSSSYNCLSVHVNNVLVFGGQGRQPSVEQLSREIRRAISGKRPGLIPYLAASACDFVVACKKHKYRI